MDRTAHRPVEPRRYQVPADLGGARLDRVLAQLVTDLSRGRLQELIRGGFVLVGGEAVHRPSATVDGGAELLVELPPAQDPPGDEPPGPGLDILFEDEHLAVIDKPAGMVTHPNDKYQRGTVADLAVRQLGELPEVQGENRPGIIHRLDRQTSGVLVLGKTEAAMLALKGQFKARSVAKTYLAIVHGSPRFDSDWINGRIAARANKPDLYRVVQEDADLVSREAETYYEVRERFAGFSYLTCKPRTGRTHQIRVHLTSIRHPIVGDRQYGRGKQNAIRLPPEAPSVERQMLHAHRIEFAHPASAERVTFEAPVPGDMALLLAWLREHLAANPD